MTPGCDGPCPLQSLSTLLKCVLSLLESSYFTIHNQNHQNITNHCVGPFPVQSLIKTIEILTLTANGFAMFCEV